MRTIGRFAVQGIWPSDDRFFSRTVAILLLAIFTAAACGQPDLPPFSLPSEGAVVSCAASPPRVGLLSRDQLLAAYNFNALYARGVSGRGQTVAVITAEVGPHIQNDANCHSLAMGLPSPKIEIVRLANKKSHPENETGWYEETALDVEMVHQLAPEARILVVVSASRAPEDVAPAVAEAVKKGANVVSMSILGKKEMDWRYPTSVFETPEIAFVAASGDDGAQLAAWPAAVSDVLAVGGTTWRRDEATGELLEELAWGGSGGWKGKDDRNVPDVAFAATLFPVYVTDFAEPGLAAASQSAWKFKFGTSAAAPAWAAIAALVRQDSGSLRGEGCRFAQAVVELGKRLPDQYFYDITKTEPGGKAHPANVGYDLATGYGTPNVSALATGIREVFRATTEAKSQTCIVPPSLIEAAKQPRPPRLGVRSDAKTNCERAAGVAQTLAGPGERLARSAIESLDGLKPQLIMLFGVTSSKEPPRDDASGVTTFWGPASSAVPLPGDDRVVTGARIAVAECTEGTARLVDSKPVFPLRDGQGGVISGARGGVPASRVVSVLGDSTKQVLVTMRQGTAAYVYEDLYGLRNGRLELLFSNGRDTNNCFAQPVYGQGTVTSVCGQRTVIGTWDGTKYLLRDVTASATPAPTASLTQLVEAKTLAISISDVRASNLPGDNLFHHAARSRISFGIELTADQSPAELALDFTLIQGTMSDALDYGIAPPNAGFNPAFGALKLVAGRKWYVAVEFHTLLGSGPTEVIFNSLHLSDGSEFRIQLAMRLTCRQEGASALCIADGVHMTQVVGPTQSADRNSCAVPRSAVPYFYRLGDSGLLEGEPQVEIRAGQAIAFVPADFRQPPIRVDATPRRGWWQGCIAATSDENLLWTYVIPNNDGGSIGLTRTDTGKTFVVKVIVRP